MHHTAKVYLVNIMGMGKTHGLWVRVSVGMGVGIYFDTHGPTYTHALSIHIQNQSLIKLVNNKDILRKALKDDLKSDKTSFI